MGTLNSYLKATYRLVNDQRFEQLNPIDLIEYCNTARREVAMRAQCVRFLTPISGSVISVTVTNGGSGFTSAPTVTISNPDFPSGAGPSPNGAQAVATSTISGGAVNAVLVSFGGYGYFQPVVTFTDGGGSGATATAVVSNINALLVGQEVYPFSGVDVSTLPGCGAVYYVRSVAVIYANYRYVLPMYSFSEYQAKIRQFPQQYQYVPAMCSQFGQGTSGSLYMYPLPSQTYQYELDCLCLPQDLLTDLSVEIIPSPWDDAVKYFMAYQAYQQFQNFNAAKYYLDLFDQHLLRYSQYARPGRITNIYGRY